MERQRLNIIVCENLLPEFEEAVQRLGCRDVIITSYRSMCDKKDMGGETAALLKERLESGCDCALICGENCDALKLADGERYFRVVTLGLCASHFVDVRFAQYVLSKGGYIVSPGWLKDWRRHLERMGFDQETARGFYRESCRELVFFEMNGGEGYKNELRAFSRYLDIPCRVVRVKSDSAFNTVKNIAAEWRLTRRAEAAETASAEASARCAEYASVMDILGRMSSCQSREDAIKSLLSIFTMLMGASEAAFYDMESGYSGLPKEALPLTRNIKRKYISPDGEARFFVSIADDETVYGVVSAGGFIFPQYTRRYLNFAVGMSRICGLAFSNIENYTRLAKSQIELKRKSYQDPLTGLRNRAFYYDMTKDGTAGNSGGYEKTAVFSFDIDGLKYVNDHFGHLEGDKLIVAASSILKKCFRDSDEVVRMGGDEFLALVPDCGSVETAERIRKRLEKAVDDYNSGVTEAHLRVGLSIGYAIRGDETETAQTMLNRADEYMYRDKAERHAARPEIPD